MASTPTRPQLSAVAADDFTALKYLEMSGSVAAPVADAWDPTGGVGDVAALTPTYRVAARGGTDTSVQSAVDKAVAAGGSERVAIEVGVGTYRELVCVPKVAPPITLYSKSSDPSATRIVFDNAAGKTKDATTPLNPCQPVREGERYGTRGSATVFAQARGFRAKNLTIENDADESELGSGAQAVALAAQGDQQIYENVRLLGNQDTFFAQSPSAEEITRVYVTHSFIQGDTDFIFGRSVLVIDQSEIHFISSRSGSKGYCLAPSTDARNPRGMLVQKSRFTADTGTLVGTIFLGRAWDESGKDLTTYAAQVSTGVFPNGQAVVRESTLGSHIRASDPWSAAATTARPFSNVAASALPANRLAEYANRLAE